MLTGQMLINPFIVLWKETIILLPKIILALVVFAIGWFIAKLLYKLIVKISRRIKLDDFFKPLMGTIERSGYHLSLGRIIAFLVKWFVIIAFLVVALDILNLTGTKALLIGLLSYIPQVIIAVLILIAGSALAEFTKNLVLASTAFFNVKYATFLANLAKIVLIIFTVLVALDLLVPNSAIIQTLFTGIVFMLALAGGLAFGLGGRDAARDAIESFKRSMRQK